MALLAHTSASVAGSAPISTPAIDTTGATLIVIGMVNVITDLAGLLSDSAGNTWTLKTAIIGTASRFFQFAYCINPTTSGSHVFTLSGGNCFYPGLAVLAFSNTPAASFVAISTGADFGAGTTGQPGSITPSNANNLLVTYCVGDLDTSAVVNGVFHPAAEVMLKTTKLGACLAYAIQAAATTQNPTWTVGGNSGGVGTQMMEFKENGGGGGGSSVGAAAHYYYDMMRRQYGF